MELTLAADIIRDGVGLGLQWGAILGVEYLRCPVKGASEYWHINSLSVDWNIQGLKIERQGKVVNDRILERSPEEELAVIDISIQLQGICGITLVAQNSPRLEHKLVRRVIGALEEDKLILMREVQRPAGVFRDAEVDRLDAARGVVGPVVRGWEHLSTTESRLHIVVRGGEDG